MTLFSIDCHACGARNTIDRDTLRRVAEPVVYHIYGPDPKRLPDPREYENRGGRKICSGCGKRPSRCVCRVTHLGSPEPAGDSDWPDPESAA